MAGFHVETGTAPQAQAEDGPGLSRPAMAGIPSRGIVSADLFCKPGASVSRPVGYALRAGRAVGAEDGYSIVALDEAGRVVLALGPFCEADVVATWRSLGQSSGLPLLIEHGPGDLRPACDQVGPVRLGRIRIRRRHAFLGGRRPRFLVRRKPGRVTAPTRLLRRRGEG